MEHTSGEMNPNPAHKGKISRLFGMASLGETCKYKHHGLTLGGVEPLHRKGTSVSQKDMHILEDDLLRVTASYGHITPHSANSTATVPHSSSTFVHTPLLNEIRGCLARDCDGGLL